MDGFILIPKSQYRSFVKLETNWDPQLLITTSSSPKSLHTISLNILANPSNVTSPFVRASLMCLDNQLNLVTMSLRLQMQ